MYKSIEIRSVLTAMLFGVLLFGCKKTDDVEPDTESTSAQFYFIGEIDGEEVRFETFESKPYTMGHAASNSGSTLSGIQYEESAGTLFQSLSGLLGGGVSPFLGIGYNYVHPDQWESHYFNWDSLLTIVGNQSFGLRADFTEDLKDPIKGVYLEYSPDGLEYWGTDVNAANQTGSSFVVNSSRYIEDNVNGSGYVVKGTINCMLYDSDGESKEVNNARFKIRYIPHF